MPFLNKGIDLNLPLFTFKGQEENTKGGKEWRAHAWCLRLEHIDGAQEANIISAGP